MLTLSLFTSKLGSCLYVGINLRFKKYKRSFPKEHDLRYVIGCDKSMQTHMRWSFLYKKVFQQGSVIYLSEAILWITTGD